MDDGGSGTRVDPREVHDFWPRLLAGPVLGALVANLSGLIDHTRHSTISLIGSYAWFATIAFLVWEGNRRLYFRLQRREDWLLRPWRRLGSLLTVITLYTIPIAAAPLWIWREVTGDGGTRQHSMATALFAIVALVVASRMSTKPCFSCVTGKAIDCVARAWNRRVFKPSSKALDARSIHTSSSTTSMRSRI